MAAADNNSLGTVADKSSDQSKGAKIQITIMAQNMREGNKCIKLEVKPNDSVRRVLAKYLAPSDLGTQIPNYLERAFYVGKEVQLKAGQTFGQSCIEVGTTVHALLRPGAVRILIINVHTQEVFALDTLTSVTVFKLKTMIRERQKPAQRIPNTKMMLKYNGETLEDYLTLGDHRVNNYGKLQLNIQYAFKVRTPGPRVRLEKITAKPRCTISELKKEVEVSKHCTELHKSILRSIVRNTSGNYLHMYFDLFASTENRMRIFVDESNNERSVGRFSFSVTDDSRIVDIYDELEARQGRGVDESQIVGAPVNGLVWPNCYTFDGSWARTFTPHIIKHPSRLSERGILNLFFFCCKSKVAELNKVGACDTIAEIKEFICEQNGITAADRIFYFISRPLMDEFAWYDYDRILQDDHCCFLLKKSERRGGSMRVNIQWATCVQPVQVHVDPDGTVCSLKDRIEDDLGVPLVVQKLVFNDEQLENHQILETLGIGNDSTIHLSINPDKLENKL